MNSDTFSLLRNSSVYTLAGLTSKTISVFGIFFISLFAVSFPGLSQRSSLLRIPHVAFFIGKHFGTGVILSTAFCHLLQDAFEHLQSPEVQDKYPRVQKQTGLIILGSLLLIFIVEYVSTSYVDYLHAEPSAPSSPVESPHIPVSRLPPPTEVTPLVARPKASPLQPAFLAALFAPPRHCPLSRHDGRMLSVCVTTANHDGEVFAYPTQDFEANPEPRKEDHKVGRGRQLVGIIVLQLGIMLHSLVIGLTLALTSGGDFTSLLTAIIFHQLFEGLSLGIRIASLPASKTGGRDWFAIALVLLFALTTPVGMVIGMSSFSSHAENLPSTTLVKGIMSAISAGMLIYAATIEMLAADFVFGSLEDSPGHGHGHGGHSHEVEVDDDQEAEQPGLHPSPGRRALALGSVLAGVTSMVLVSLGE